MTYVPQPMDVKDVQLPDELNEIVEVLAKNVHELWAHGRIEQGWIYGIERDDSLKTHPSLIPYEELPEAEKEYDRKTALGTLQFITKSGFKISKE